MTVSANNAKGRPRRSHRKSRLGCDYCKRRKIKCDETRPVCSHCARRNLPCSFTQPDPGIQDRSGPPTWDSRDMALLHHFCFSTAPSFTPRKPGLAFWNATVPRLAFEHDFLLHAVLAVAALHKVSLGRSGDVEAWAATKATMHWDAALRLAAADLPHMTQRSYAAHHLFASLTCLHVFATGPREGDYLVFRDDAGEASWLSLFRMLHTIEQQGRHHLVDESLLPMFSMALVDLTQVNLSTLPTHVDEAFDDLHAALHEGDVPPEQAAVCDTAAALLKACFALVHSPDLASYAAAHAIFAWLYRVSDAYLELLQTKKTPALLVLSYFVVLVAQMGNGWMFRGWPAHVMSGIWATLPVSSRVWVAWPVSRVGWLPVERYNG